MDVYTRMFRNKCDVMQVTRLSCLIHAMKPKGEALLKNGTLDSAGVSDQASSKSSSSFSKKTDTHNQQKGLVVLLWRGFVPFIYLVTTLYNLICTGFSLYVVSVIIVPFFNWA